MANSCGFQAAKNCWSVPTRQENGVHVDVALELDKGVLGFADRRHFGRVHAWESAEACPGLRVLGIDALSLRFHFPAALPDCSRRPSAP